MHFRISQFIELYLPVMLLAAGVSGCSTPPPTEIVSKPSNITLKNAIIQTVEALYAGEQRSKDLSNGVSNGGLRLGLLPCTVTAVFNVTAAGTEGDQLLVSLSGGPAATTMPVSFGVQGSHQTSFTANRGNTITVFLTTPACNPDKTLGTTSPAKVTTLAKQMFEVTHGYPPPRGTPLAPYAITPFGVKKLTK